MISNNAVGRPVTPQEMAAKAAAHIEDACFDVSDSRVYFHREAAANTIREAIDAALRESEADVARYEAAFEGVKVRVHDAEDHAARMEAALREARSCIDPFEYPDAVKEIDAALAAGAAQEGGQGVDRQVVYALANLLRALNSDDDGALEVDALAVAVRRADGPGVSKLAAWLSMLADELPLNRGAAQEGKA